MGARQRAFARKSKRPNPSNRPPPSNDWQDFSDPKPRGGFSMSQEARNTERHAGWGNTKLRDQRVLFVSAGNLTRQEAEVEVEETIGKEIDDRDKVAVQNIPDDKEDTAEIVKRLGLAALSDRVDEPEQSTQEPTKHRESFSSEVSEEIVFAGRLKSTLTPVTGSKPSSRPSHSPLPKSECKVADTTPSSPPVVRAASPSVPVKKHAYPRRAVDRRGRPKIRKPISDSDEAIMQDYIANMAVDDDDDDDGDDHGAKSGPAAGVKEHFRFYDGSAETHVKVQTKLRDPNTRPFLGIDQAIDWDSADLGDFDDLPTTDDDVDEISQVLRHRDRPTGQQYLVTAIGQTASDAKWVSRQRLISQTARSEIRIYEEIRAMKVQETSGDTDVDEVDEESTDDGLEDLIDDIESEDAENERILKHTARMTDEQIARALAKQEELGIGGDELLLFDDQIDGAGDDDEFLSKADFIPFSTKKHVSSRVKSKRNRRTRDSFPPAEAFADALEQDPYGAFDIMDFDRPSLRPKRKGRNMKDLPFELGVDDPELAAQLQNAWSNDREKKAARKREREVLFLEAAERSNPSAIKAEIRQFLAQEVDTLRLAPMDSTLRASVHRLAKALKLHSRSEGKEATGRFPVLTKTTHTPVYTIDTVWEVDALMNTRKYFPRQGGGRTFTSVKVRRGGGGGVMSGATYMNGDIVGASAPEIGTDNKGRAMLERMGWSSGMGIGATNQGGVDVIKHVVKTTKAGLG
ncbi:hypothetical protein LTR84_007771 [Exophiala bonariae]|uniref:G-patch domain-containing protein n=1 Tax=Exophiala bonariae TaxID=1690606 RepID=A0AAV9NNQ1_9EURO|nr:hypothetical protein LTR84_007771 [Exophiala bonariae]